MQAGNGAVAVLDSLSFSVLYISYLDTYIVEILNDLSLLNSIYLFNLCIVNFPHWFGVHLIGNYLASFKYLDYSVSIVPGSPTSGDVRIEKIMPAIFFFHIIFVVVMPVKYCFQILLLVEKFDDRGTGDTALCPGERRDMHENEQLLFGG